MAFVARPLLSALCSWLSMYLYVSCSQKREKMERKDAGSESTTYVNPFP